MAHAWTSNSAGGGGGADDNSAAGNHLVVGTLTENLNKYSSSGELDANHLIADTITSNYAKNGGRSGGFDCKPARNIVVDRQLAAPRVARQAKGAFTDPVNDNIIAFAQNTRDEVRMLDGDGRLSGESAAQPGMKQQTFIAFESRYARNGRGAPDEVVPPLKAQSGESGKGDGAPLVAFSSKDYGQDAAEDISPTLRAQNHAQSHINGGGQVAVAQCIKGSAIGRAPQNGPQRGEILENQSYTLNATEVHAVAHYGVRRLTPTECSRLQGFPDDWNKSQSDSQRYRQFGNAVAVPVVEWIGRKIVAAYEAGYLFSEDR